jgi:ribonuclease P protein component
MTSRFRADEHIRVRADFEHIYESGAKHSGRLMTVFVRRTERDTARLGIAATRKLGGAVVRNHAKRLVRELFRHHKPPAGTDVVVIPRREMLDAPFTTLEAEFAALLGPRKPRPGLPRDVARRPARAHDHPRV